MSLTKVHARVTSGSALRFLPSRTTAEMSLPRCIPNAALSTCLSANDVDDFEFTAPDDLAGGAAVLSVTNVGDCMLDAAYWTEASQAPIQRTYSNERGEQVDACALGARRRACARPPYCRNGRCGQGLSQPRPGTTRPTRGPSSTNRERAIPTETQRRCWERSRSTHPLPSRSGETPRRARQR